MKRSSFLYDRLLDFLFTIACFVLGFVVVLVSFDVVMRYGFNRPKAYALPLTELSLVLIVSLGNAWLLKEEGHIVIDLLIGKLKPMQKYILNIITSIISAIVLFIIGIYSFPQIIFLIKHNVKWMETSTLLPAYVYMIPLTVSYFLFSIQFLRRSFLYFKLYQNTQRKVG
jgi:TRAP-type C4-dicarboxylate transport system permease small subunit